GLAGDQFRYSHAFFKALVCEHRAAHAIADRPDAFDAGPAMVVDFDAPARIQAHASAFGDYALRVGAAADRDEQLVDGDLLLALGIGECDFDGVAFDFSLADFRAEANVEPLFGELARSDLGDVAIGGTEKVGQRFEHGHFGAEAAPDAAEL